MARLHLLNTLLVLNFISFVACVKVQFFQEEDFEGEMFQTMSSTTCEKLSTEFPNVGSMKTSGCIVVFTDNNCRNNARSLVGKSEEKLITGNGDADNNVSIKSFRNCVGNDADRIRNRRFVDHQQASKRFEAFVINLEPRFDASNLKGRVYRNSFLHETFTAKLLERTSTFNGGTLQEETAQFSFPETLHQMSSIKFEKSTLFKFGASIPFLFSNATEKLKAELEKAFSNGAQMNLDVTTSGWAWIDQKMAMPKCTKLDASAFYEMTRDASITYRVLLEITGEEGTSGRKLTAEQIRNALQNNEIIFMDGGPNVDELTAVAETTATLTADYISNIGVDLNIKQIEGCK